jgi:hypothetical protein
MKCPEPTLLKDKDLLTGITDKIGTKGFADLDRRGTNPSVYAGCAHFLPSFGPPIRQGWSKRRVRGCMRGKSFTLLVPAVRPLANIGNASRTMNKIASCLFEAFWIWEREGSRSRLPLMRRVYGF